MLEFLLKIFLRNLLNFLKFASGFRLAFLNFLNHIFNREIGTILKMINFFCELVLFFRFYKLNYFRSFLFRIIFLQFCSLKIKIQFFENLNVDFVLIQFSFYDGVWNEYLFVLYWLLYLVILVSFSLFLLLYLFLYFLDLVSLFLQGFHTEIDLPKYSFNWSRQNKYNDHMQTDEVNHYKTIIILASLRVVKSNTRPTCLR